MPLHKRGKPMSSNIRASRHGTRLHQSGDLMPDSDSGCGDTEGLRLHKVHLARAAGMAVKCPGARAAEMTVLAPRTRSCLQGSVG